MRFLCLIFLFQSVDGIPDFPTYKHSSARTQQCILCPPGYRLRGDMRDCPISSDGSETFPDCVACPGGYFTSSWSLRTTCDRKHVCNDDSDVELSGGGNTDDRVCGCRRGYYHSDEQDACVPVQSSCPPVPKCPEYLAMPCPAPIPCPTLSEVTSENIPKITCSTSETNKATNPSEFCQPPPGVHLRTEIFVLILILCFFGGILTMFVYYHVKTARAAAQQDDDDKSERKKKTMLNQEENGVKPQTGDVPVTGASGNHMNNIQATDDINPVHAGQPLLSQPHLVIIPEESQYAQIDEIDENSSNPALQSPSLTTGQQVQGSQLSCSTYLASESAECKRTHRLDIAFRCIEDLLTKDEHAFFRQGLKLKPQEIDKLDAEYQTNVSKKMMQALQYWKGREANSATAERLIEILKTVSRNDIAETIKQQLGDDAESNHWV